MLGSEILVLAANRESCEQIVDGGRHLEPETCLLRRAVRKWEKEGLDPLAGTMNANIPVHVLC